MKMETSVFPETGGKISEFLYGPKIVGTFSAFDRCPAKGKK
jgi:hypothetical protein